MTCLELDPRQYSAADRREVDPPIPDWWVDFPAICSGDLLQVIVAEIYI
jgi:hypothetical protein